MATRRRRSSSKHPTKCRAILSRGMKHARGSKTEMRAVMKAYNRCRGVGR